MQKLVTGMPINRGFTLIEILIVIVIIGITVGFALIAFGDFGQNRRLQFSAEQLSNTLRLAQQQALLETTTLGLRIDNISYQILKFQASSGWNPISTKGVFKMTYFPKNTVITLKTANTPPPDIPTVVINSSGDMTPFTLSIGTSKDTVVITLKGFHNGHLILNEVKKR